MYNIQLFSLFKVCLQDVRLARLVITVAYSSTLTNT